MKGGALAVREQDLSHEQLLGVKVEEIPLVFDCKYLAKILGCSVSTARSIMNQPGFPVLRLSAKKHRIYRAKFLEWLEKQSSGTTDHFGKGA